MNKKSILVDLDYCLCIPGFLSIVNKFLGTNYVEDDFEEYIIDDVFGKRADEFYEYYLTQDGYKDAKVIDGAYEVLEKLNEKYDVYILSACVMYGVERKSAKLFKDKFEYIMRTFPFISPEKIIFTNSKNMFNADIQIDDRLPNLAGNIKTKLLFCAYHNRKITDEELKRQNVTRVKSWQDIAKILL